MRSFLLFFAGAITSGLVGLLGWLASTECPPNRLLLSVELPEPMTAEVLIQGQSIWKGSRNLTETINFPMMSGEGQFLVRKSDGTSQSLGYVERADGQDHILFIYENSVAYSTVNRGLIELIRRRTACRN
jgi:hypothetical protein